MEAAEKESKEGEEQRLAPQAAERKPSRATEDPLRISRPRENMVGVNMVLAEYHQNTLK